LTQKRVIGLDAGGTEIKAGLLLGGEILKLRRFPTEREHGPDHAVKQILAAAASMHEEFPEAEAIALVVPGVVDSKKGIAEYSENILWKNVPFGPELHRVTGLPWGFGHDVRFAGLAEATYGAGKGYSDSFFLAIGTGIAGAMVVNGDLIDNPYGGEIGHLDVHSGHMCACGVIGCLESISTSPSVYKLYAELSGSGGTRAGGSHEVVEAAKAGDLHAQEAWRIATTAIGEAIAAYISILAPDLVVLGGGVANAGEDLIKPIEAHLDSRLTFQKRPKIVITTLGDTAGMIGAGILASRALNT
jgi:glucokinase